jgi:hypothetical protein
MKGVFGTTVQESTSFDEWQNQPRVITQEESLEATEKLAWRDTGTGLLARHMVLKELESTGAKPISAAEANKLYPFMDEPFRDDINPYVAKMKADDYIERMELQDKIARGPQDGWTKAKQFGVGALAHMMDPLEFVAAQGVGLSLGGLAVGGALGARAAQASRAGTLGYTAGEALGSSLIENIGIEGAQKFVENEEGIVDPRTKGQIATDIVVGSLFETALQAAPKAFRNTGPSLKSFLKQTSPEADRVIVGQVVHAAETGVVPNLTPMVKSLAQETSVKGEFVGYEYKPLTSETAPTTKFYTATKYIDPDAPRITLGDDVGFGTHLTDHPGVANSAASRSMAEGTGTVSEVNITALRPLDLSEPLPEHLFKQFDDLFQKYEMGYLKEQVPPRILLEEIKNQVDDGAISPDVFEDVKSIFTENGYDSLISNGRTRTGFEHTPHNNVILLDKSKMKEVSIKDANPEIRNEPTETEFAEYKQQFEKPQKFLEDPDTYQKQVAELEEFNPQAASDLGKELDAVLEDMKLLEAQGTMTEADLKVFEEARNDIQKAEQLSTLVKAFKSCVLGMGG